jgi:hypothetical protein
MVLIFKVPLAIRNFDIRQVPYLISCVSLGLLRSYGKLLFYAQQIVNSVQNRVLPLHVILQSKDRLGRAGINYSKRRYSGLLSRDDGQSSLQLRPRLSEQFYRLLPREPARGDDEPLRRIGGRNLEREYVRARNVTHVDIHRYATSSAIVPRDGAIRCAADEPVDETVRARCGRIVHLSRAQGPIDVRRMDRRHVEIWVSALEIAHGEICEALRD